MVHLTVGLTNEAVLLDQVTWVMEQCHIATNGPTDGAVAIELLIICLQVGPEQGVC